MGTPSATLSRFARVYGELYQGDAIAGATDAGKFDLLAVCAEELRPIEGLMVPKRTRLLDAGIDDAELTEREAKIAEGAAQIIRHDLVLGRRVLVVCFMGLNRSGLVSALSLVRTYGMPSSEAIRLVRSARGPRALSNESFVRYLRRCG